MKKFVFIGALAGGLALSGGFNTARAENAAEEAPIPANMASYHVPAFQNDLIRLLNVDIPAGRNSGFHIHRPDLITVVVEDSDSIAQEPGRPPNPMTHQPRGNVAYTTYGQGLIHSVANAGRAPYHIIGVEILNSQPGRFTPTSRTDVPAYVQVLDNEHVRGWRLVLGPGQSVAAITQRAPGIRVVVDGGEIAESVPGETDRAMLLKLGEFSWQEPGITRAIHNRGTTRVEFVEFELK